MAEGREGTGGEGRSADADLRLPADTDMVISLLAAYGIPCFKYYDLDGGAGKVINGFSGFGASLYVPQSRLEEAQELLQAQPVEDEETEQHA